MRFFPTDNEIRALMRAGYMPSAIAGKYCVPTMEIVKRVAIILQYKWNEAVIPYNKENHV